jgi:methylsterol monooxygenase
MATNVAYNLIEKYAPVLAEHLVTVNATTAQNQLYPGVDLLGLNWLERTWASYYIWMGNPVLATGLLSFVIHEVSPALCQRTVAIDATAEVPRTKTGVLRLCPCRDRAMTGGKSSD